MPWVRLLLYSRMSSSLTRSERRLTANRANAQKSTGPRSEAGKAVSSLNAVKTVLTGRTLVFADEAEADAYRAHVERVTEGWEPVGDRESTLVQSLADTQWRLNSIPGLESGLYALGRLRGVQLFPQAAPEVQKILLSAQVLTAEARALKNLHLQEGRLRRQYQKDEEELIKLQRSRFYREREEEREEQVRRQQAEEEQRREEQARKRVERKKARAAAPAESVDGGFEFANQNHTPVIAKETPMLSFKPEENRME